MDPGRRVDFRVYGFCHVPMIYRWTVARTTDAQVGTYMLRPGSQLALYSVQGGSRSGAGKDSLDRHPDRERKSLTVIPVKKPSESCCTFNRFTGFKSVPDRQDLTKPSTGQVLHSKLRQLMAPASNCIESAKAVNRETVNIPTSVCIQVPTYLCTYCKQNKFIPCVQQA